MKAEYRPTLDLISYCFLFCPFPGLGQLLLGEFQGSPFEILNLSWRTVFALPGSPF